MAHRPMTPRPPLRLLPIACALLLLAACQRERIAFTTLDLPSDAEAAEALELRTFRPEAHGAIADGLFDCGPAIRAAIAQAIGHGPGARVLFTRGDYRVESLHDAGALRAFVLEGAEEMLLESEEGARIVVGNPRATAFALLRCRAVAFSGIEVDYDAPPFSQGVVRAVDPPAGTVDIEVDEGFPLLDAPWFRDPVGEGRRWGLLFDAEGGGMKADAPDFLPVEGARRVGGEGRVFRLAVPAWARGDLPDAEPGDRWVQIVRPAGAAAFLLHESHSCMLAGVVVRASPGAAVSASASDGLRVQDSVFAPAPGSGRLLSANTGAIQVVDARRGPIIDGCRIESPGGDAIVVAPVAASSVARAGAETVQFPSGFPVSDGDILAFVEPGGGEAARRIAAEARPAVGGGKRVVLSDAPPPGVEGLRVFNLSRTAEGFRISNNRIDGGVGHAIRLAARNGVVEANTIVQPRGFGIVAGGLADGREAPASSGLVLRGNLVRNAAMGRWHAEDPDGAAIVVGAAGGRRGAENIQLEDNRMMNAPATGILVRGVRGAVLRGNVLAGTREHEPARAGAAIRIADSANALLLSNGVNDPRPRVIAAVRIDEDCAPSEQGVRVGDLRASLAPASIEIDDRRAAPAAETRPEPAP